MRNYADGVLPRVVQCFRQGDDLCTEGALGEDGSRQIAIAAHDDCAANPIQAHQQQDQVIEGAAFLKNRFPQCDILGLWVDDARKVHEIAPS